MASRKPKVLIDSCALIALIEGKQGMERILPLLRQIDAGEVQLIESVVVLGEVYKVPSRQAEPEVQQRREKQLAVIRNRLCSRSVLLVDVTRPVIEAATRYRIDGAVKGLPDAIHLATAVLNGCDWFITFDRGFRDVEGVTMIRQRDFDDQEALLPWETMAPTGLTQGRLLDEEDSPGPRGSTAR